MGDDSSDRIGYFSHAIDRSQLKPGDHIYVYHALGAYSHHGIYTGKPGREVIHFCGDQKSSKWNAMIRACSLDEFCDGGTLRLVGYGGGWWGKLFKRGGTRHRTESRPADDVIATAERYLDNPEKWGNYHLLFNNCETFAVYCKTGHKVSAQIDKVGV